ncbi:ATP-binding protein [Phytohabitans sp. ZYX-F-186]|uniref:ATP-binding protein n=1 Tax=Phytohabitans maris TaxID=3071409 RepID=A0ABU0ZKB1_9ACTN|nr:ATP-binding protein [Phytohabitans sp. ZYX-F-186]
MRPLLHVAVVPGRLPALRLQVEAIARDRGMSPDRASDWVTAVNELMANVVRHGGGTGDLRIWLEGDLFCEIRDHGPGFIAEPYVDRSDRPAPSGDGGMGLWIARQMSDGMEIDSGPSGTVVRIRTRMDAGA